MDMKPWLDRVAHGASTYEMSDRTAEVGERIPQPTLAKQISSGNVPLTTVIRLARAYGVSPVDAMVELGALDEAEARDAAGLLPMLVREALHEAKDREILSEIGRRFAERRSESTGDHDVVEEDLTQELKREIAKQKRERDRQSLEG